MSDKKSESEKSCSGEVINGFRSCRDLSDIVPLLSSKGLYLKPAAKIYISIKLPQLKIPGISTNVFHPCKNYKIVEKLVI